MKAEYRHDLKNNYLVIEAGEEGEEEDYCFHMVEQNTIPGLLQLHRSRMDGKLFLNYEITGKQSIAGLFEQRKMQYGDIVSLLSGISEHLETFRKYLLDPEKLIFDPQFIFREPNRNTIWFCYAPAMKGKMSFALLAEFILKRLDHRDAEAVALGYQFYAKTREENISLAGILRELLVEDQTEAEPEFSIKSGGCKYEAETHINSNGGTDDKSYRAADYRTAGYRTYKTTVYGSSDDKDYKTEKYNNGAYGNVHRDLYETGRRAQTDRVSEQKRRRKTDTGTGIAARIFSVIHPAVLLSALLLFALLEMGYYFQFLNLTETGGCLFLILSAELLANSFWKKAKEEKERAKKQAFGQMEDEEEESYMHLQEEMYEKEGERAKRGEYIGETRCLTDLPTERGIRLIHVTPYNQRDQEGAQFPDILIREGEMVTVGKLQEQCEILLESETVSRVHARLEYHGDEGMLRDLNSRNGTFLNGDRLNPQEIRSFHDGDRIAFADIQYRVVQVAGMRE